VTNSRCPSKHDGDSSGRDTQSRRRVRQRAKAEEDEDMRGLYRAGVVQLLTRARDEEAGRQLRVKMRKLKASNVFLWPVVAPTTELEEAAVTSSSIIRAAGRQGGQEGLDTVDGVAPFAPALKSSRGPPSESRSPSPGGAPCVACWRRVMSAVGARAGAR